MKLYRFVLLVAFCAATIVGCGGESEKESAQKNDSQNQTGDKEATEQMPAENNKPAEKKDAKPVKVSSTLPFKDLDVSSASKGIDPGRILIDVKGKDSTGKEMALSDYKGKVILLDTWASW